MPESGADQCGQLSHRSKSKSHFKGESFEGSGFRRYNNSIKERV